MPDLDLSGAEPEGVAAIPTISVPEIRDYGRINPEIVRLLNEGHRRIRLAGVQGQRLLVAGLKGTWDAEVVLEGQAGPELASDLDAPGLSVICLGSAADGPGRGMKAGRLLVMGNAGDAPGYEQSGGTIVVAGSSGNRAGLRQSGGRIVLGGRAGRLAADRQSGGIFIYFDEAFGPHFGHGRTGGHLVRWDVAESDQLIALREAVRPLVPWLPPALRDAIFLERAGKDDGPESRNR